ncbi:MAG: hypothetical protein LIQ30_03545, partial [Planctomycetes bacterium]|nr:hypothetical protein [Planctomycetota bacterium]
MPRTTGASRRHFFALFLLCFAVFASTLWAQEQFYDGSLDDYYPDTGGQAVTTPDYLSAYTDDSLAPAGGTTGWESVPGAASAGSTYGAPDSDQFSYEDYDYEGYDDGFVDPDYADYPPSGPTGSPGPASAPAGGYTPAPWADDSAGYDDGSGAAGYDDGFGGGDAGPADDYGLGAAGQEYRENGPIGEIGGPDAEGNMVTEIEVLNTVTTTPEQIIYRMSTRVGHPLRERTLDGDFQRLASMGLFDDIQIRKEMVAGGVKITVVVREKDIIRRIEFVGNQQVATRKLNPLIESKVGERYDAGKANRDRRAIEDFLHREYYYFGEVEVSVEPFEDGVRLLFDVSEGGRLYVGDIQFRGNTVFNRKELLAKMETKRSGLISRGKYLRRAFERDLERIRMSYLDKGYLDVRVIERPMQITANQPKSRWQRRDVFINVDIDEGEQYRV